MGVRGAGVGCAVGRGCGEGRAEGQLRVAIGKKLKKGLAHIWRLVYSNQAAEARGVSSVG